MIRFDPEERCVLRKTNLSGYVVYLIVVCVSVCWVGVWGCLSGFLLGIVRGGLSGCLLCDEGFALSSFFVRLRSPAEFS